MNWEALFRSKIASLMAASADPAHDLSHFERVASMALRLCAAEGGEIAVVLPAAWLHDFIVIAKDDPRRSRASRLSAEAAIDYLRSVDYPSKWFEEIAHAIEAHSFSAGVACQSLEARIVQDADRLDALGAVGLARLFVTAGVLKRPLYSSSDPFCVERAPDDALYTIDHVYRKLLVVADTLQTASGREEGVRRRAVLERYLSDLSSEIGRR